MIFQIMHPTFLVRMKFHLYFPFFCPKCVAVGIYLSTNTLFAISCCYLYSITSFDFFSNFAFTICSLIWICYIIFSLMVFWCALVPCYRKFGFFIIPGNKSKPVLVALVFTTVILACSKVFKRSFDFLDFILNSTLLDCFLSDS